MRSVAAIAGERSAVLGRLKCSVFTPRSSATVAKVEHRHQRRSTGPKDPAHAELRLCRLRQRDLPWHKRPDERGLGGFRLKRAGNVGGNCAVNRRNHRVYSEILRDIPGISVAPYDKLESNNYQYVVIEVDQSEAGLSRDQLQAVLHAENVLARRILSRLPSHGAYRSLFLHAHLLLPNTEWLAHCVLQVPTGTTVEEEDVRIIGGIVREAVSAAHEIRRV